MFEISDIYYKPLDKFFKIKFFWIRLFKFRTPDKKQAINTFDRSDL